MGHLAGRGESTGDGDQDDLLVLELYSQTRPSAACFSHLTLVTISLRGAAQDRDRWDVLYIPWLALNS
jgi:hypothetical protein